MNQTMDEAKKIVNDSNPSEFLESNKPSMTTRILASSYFLYFFVFTKGYSPFTVFHLLVLHWVILLCR